MVSRDPSYNASGATVVTSLAEALAAAKGDEAFVIGGAEIYTAAMPMADRLQLTEIDADFPGDSFFPALDPRHWREAARETHHDEAGLGYAFVSYERIRQPGGTVPDSR